MQTGAEAQARQAAREQVSLLTSQSSVYLPDAPTLRWLTGAGQAMHDAMAPSREGRVTQVHHLIPLCSGVHSALTAARFGGLRLS